jgi:DnaJ-class molecular chaperone
MEEPKEPDHYAILGLSQYAEAEEIRRAYLTLALSSHPDRNRGISKDWFCQVFKFFKWLLYSP